MALAYVCQAAAFASRSYSECGRALNVTPFGQVVSKRSLKNGGYTGRNLLVLDIIVQRFLKLV